MRFILLAFVFTMLVASCAIGSGWPHENFKEIYGGKVGENADDPNLLAGGYPKKKVGSTYLPNGNIEVHYVMDNPWGQCDIFYEVNSETRVIVSWRYQGSHEACSIPP